MVFPACVYVGTHIESPGVVCQSGGICIIIFGKDPRNPEVNPDKICSLMEKAHIKFNWSENYVIVPQN